MVSNTLPPPVFHPKEYYLTSWKCPVCQIGGSFDVRQSSLEAEEIEHAIDHKCNGGLVVDSASEYKPPPYLPPIPPRMVSG